MLVKIRCELCTQIIGQVESETVHEPLTGAQILSRDPDHGIPAPFHPSLGRLSFRCPYGPKDHQRGHIPFHREGMLWTEDRDWLKFGENYVRENQKTHQQKMQDRINRESIEDSFDRWRDSEEIKKDSKQALTCDYCGKEFNHRSSKSRHAKTCEANPNNVNPEKANRIVDVDMRLDAISS